MGGEVLALAGGVGGAKLALGMARVLPPEELVVVVNTGDDECFHGLHVSPDLDTVMYTLASLVNPETGWGLAGDTFNSLAMLRRYGAEAWFNLGDRGPGDPYPAHPTASPRGRFVGGNCPTLLCPGCGPPGSSNERRPGPYCLGYRRGGAAHAAVLRPKAQ